MPGILLFADEIQRLSGLRGRAEELRRSWGGPVTVAGMTPGVISAVRAGGLPGGADRTRVWEGYELDAEGITEGLAQVCQEEDPDLVMISTGKRYRDVAARLATRLRAGCISECTSIERARDGRAVAERVVYGGNAVASVVSRTRPVVVTVAGTGLVPSARGGLPEIVPIDGRLPVPRVQRLSVKPVEVAADLASAQRIVAVGRGFAKVEDLKIAEELAAALQAELGCSRPLAEDLGWLPLSRQVGLTGVQVSPRLYVAVGISGQIQHLVGIRDAEIIVAINRDPEAPIFRVADYGIIGDLYAVVQALIDALRSRVAK